MLNQLKNNVQYLWGKLSENDFELPRKKLSAVSDKFQSVARRNENEFSADSVNVDNYQYESHRIDDLQLTIVKDPGPGIKYNYTENSEFARGAEKAPAVGIDSFGEEDTFDPDVADDHQDYRNRKHQSDLSDRFFTHGLDNHSKDLQH